MQVQKYYGRDSNICDVFSRNCIMHLISNIARIFCVSQKLKDVERSDQCEVLKQYGV
jgi:hypothetical protein